MSRDGSGNYSLPLAAVVGGNTIDASWANTTLNDLAAEMQDSLSRSGKGGMSTALKLADGVVGTPGLTFTNDPNTGFYRSAADVLNVAIGGADKFRWNAGNIAQVWNGSAWKTVAFDGSTVPVLTITTGTVTTLGSTTATIGTANITTGKITTLNGAMNAANYGIDNAKTVQFNGEVDNGNAGAADTIAMDAGQKQLSTLNAATVTLTLTEPTSVGNWLLKLVGTSGSSPTITWATTGTANVYWAGGSQPTWSNDGTDLVSLYYDGTNFYASAVIGFA